MGSVPLQDIWSLLSLYPVVQPQWKAPTSLKQSWSHTGRERWHSLISEGTHRWRGGERRKGKEKEGEGEGRRGEGLGMKRESEGKGRWGKDERKGGGGGRRGGSGKVCRLKGKEERQD